MALLCSGMETTPALAALGCSRYTHRETTTVCELPEAEGVKWLEASSHPHCPQAHTLTTLTPHTTPVGSCVLDLSLVPPRISNFYLLWRGWTPTSTGPP